LRAECDDGFDHAASGVAVVGSAQRGLAHGGVAGAGVVVLDLLLVFVLAGAVVGRIVVLAGIVVGLVVVAPELVSELVSGIVVCVPACIVASPASWPRPSASSSSARRMVASSGTSAVPESSSRAVWSRLGIASNASRHPMIHVGMSVRSVATATSGPLIRGGRRASRCRASRCGP
jgi:hypothetical protein